MLTYQVLGPVQVARDGNVLPLSASKPRAVLLALLARAGEVVSTDHLHDVLWGDGAPPSAAKLVQVYVSQLRALLGPEAIETVAPGYRLPLGPGDADAIDAHRFERLHREATEALREGHAELAHALADRALALWRGPAFAEVAYEPFADHVAMRLEQLRDDCVGVQLDARLAKGDHHGAVADLVAVCAASPLHEGHHERLALALYRSGEQREALASVSAVRTRLRDELGLELRPSLRRLEQAILDQDPALELDVDPAIARLSAPRLPTPPTPLVGREPEIAALRALLSRDDVRIVTLSGAGGSGKTRLAIELAHGLRREFGGGATMVELASVRDPELVLAAIARELGVVETPTEAADVALVTALEGRELLLVLDNFEHVIAAASDVARLVRALPRLTVLVTTRRVLHVTGEHVYPLAPLPAADAVALFAARARARDATVDLGAEATLLAICSRVDCLPLAVELAAAQTAVLAPARLLQRLTASVAELGIGPRDAPARQQTLSDTVAWSVALLSPEERQAMERASAFAGGFSLDAIETIGGATLSAVGGLVDASLLQPVVAPDEPRYAMLETIREHAAATLAASGDQLAVEQAHAEYYAALAEATPLKGGAMAEGMRRLDPDLDNLRLAHDRAVARGDDAMALRIGAALYRYWYGRGLFREGRDRIGGPIERGAGRDDGAVLADALRSLAGLHHLLGDQARADEIGARGIAIGTQSGNLEAVLGCHTVLGLSAQRRHDLDAARSHIQQSGTIAQSLGLELDQSVANTNLGEIALEAGDLDEARSRWEQTIEWNHRSGAGDDTFALLGLGEVARRQGLLEESIDHFRAARAIAEASRSPHNKVMAILGEACVAADRGDVEDAGELLGYVDAMASTTTGTLHGVDAVAYDNAARIIEAAVGATRFHELRERGAGRLH